MPSQTLLGPAGSIEFGGSVGSAGDVNEDGYGDVLLGDASARAALLFLGPSPGLDSSSIVTLSTPDMCGASVASGDLDGDGHADAVVANAFAGRLCIFYGDGATLTTRVGATIIGPGFGFGTALGAGAVNGDGFADISTPFEEVLDSSRTHSSSRASTSPPRMASHSARAAARSRSLPSRTPVRCADPEH